MKTIATLATCLAVAFSSGKPTWEKEVTKAEFDMMNVASVFHEWSTAFNKVYPHEEEKLNRFQIWLKNLESIANHNSKEDETYKMRLNQFGDLTGEEFEEYVHGGKGSCYHGQEAKAHRKLSALKSSSSSSTLKNKVGANPTSVDWTTKGVVTPVKNQGSCGSCWAFSATGSTECRVAIATGKLVSLSEQQLVDCSKKDGNLGCSGGLMDDAFKYIESEGGLCTEEAYPYTATDGTCKSTSCGSLNDPISTYTDVTIDNEADLETAVVSGCVSVAVEADQSSFQFYSSGILSGNCGTSTDHGVLVVGYGVSGSDEYWKVKNSWGTTWGEAGYLLICKACDKNGSKGECGINTDPSFPVNK